MAGNYKEQQGSHSWWQRHRAEVGGGAAVMLFVSVLGGIGVIQGVNANNEATLAKELQDEMPRTGFTGVIENDGNWPNQATVNLNVNRTCTLDGAFVDYTRSGHKVTIDGYDVEIYLPGSGQTADYTFANRAGMSKALGSATCGEISAELRTSDGYTGAQ